MNPRHSEQTRRILPIYIPGRFSINLNGKGRAMNNVLVGCFLRTLKQEYTYKMQELHAQIQNYIHYYNETRPPQGINQKNFYKFVSKRKTKYCYNLKSREN
ncbi:integrase core domain-containing protein [Lutibacter sp.]